MALKYLLTIGITAVALLAIIFTINYFTLFGYYLSHKSQVVYMARDDISVHFIPQFIVISDNVTRNYDLGLG